MQVIIQSNSFNLAEIRYEELWNGSNEEFWSSMGREYIKFLSEELSIPLKFKKLTTQRYNCEITPEFKLEISIISAKKIRQIFDEDCELWEQLEEVVENCTTATDGYTPFRKYDEFFTKENTDLLTGVMLEILAENLEENWEEKLWSL